jgi:hypothetical protein
MLSIFVLNITILTDVYAECRQKYNYAECLTNVIYTK